MSSSRQVSSSTARGVAVRTQALELHDLAAERPREVDDGHVAPEERNGVLALRVLDAGPAQRVEKRHLAGTTGRPSAVVVACDRVAERAGASPPLAAVLSQVGLALGHGGQAQTAGRGQCLLDDDRRADGADLEQRAFDARDRDASHHNGGFDAPPPAHDDARGFGSVVARDRHLERGVADAVEPHSNNAARCEATASTPAASTAARNDCTHVNGAGESTYTPGWGCCSSPWPSDHLIIASVPPAASTAARSTTLSFSRAVARIRRVRSDMPEQPARV